MPVLGDGLYLEKADVLIPWGVTAAEAARIGAPWTKTEEPRFEFLWGPEEIFGGLNADVHAVLHGGQRLQQLKLLPAWEQEPYSLEDHYTAVRDHLVQSLGEPAEVRENPQTSMPGYTWAGDQGSQLHLWLFDRFGEQLMLELNAPGKRSK